MKLLKKWSILFAAFLLSSCKEGPRVSFCVLDVPNSMLRCADPEQVPFDLPLAEADNYGCMKPDDWERLLKDLVKKAPVVKKEVEKKVAANPVIQKRWPTFMREK